MKFKIKLFGHEISIRPTAGTELHVNLFNTTTDEPTEPPWKHDFPMEKRIRVYVQFKGMIEYVFSRYDAAILNYGEAALYHLEAVLKSFYIIRNKFLLKGATPEQLKSFDDKIKQCFNTTMRVAEE